MILRRTLPLLGAASLVVGAVSLSPATAGGQDPTCPSPYAPLAYAQAYPAQEALPAVPGVDTARPWRPEDEPADTDGDGTADAISTSGLGSATARVVLGRADGDVVLVADGADGFGVWRAGDIDRDGRDEAIVVPFGGADEGTYLLPGTTPNGTSPVADAAILLATTPTSTAMAPDASDRLLVTPSSGGPAAATVVHDGGDVLALGAGADATAVEPEATYDGRLTAVTSAPASGEAVATLVTTTVVLGPPTVGGTEAVLLTVVDGEGEVHELTTEPEPVASADPGPGVEVIEGELGTFVVLGMASRSGASEHLWWLDDPCGTLPGAATPPTTTPAPDAPPARPVPAPARFTG